ncbi:MBL fold metallo-hydrolase [Candidatus Aerophobetes bacterium]|nr:MBL fold metallo-hydrolase [Candidatus Aerophobetes bacterium]
MSAQTIQVGAYALSFISDGYFYLDAGTMFCRIPKTVWSRFVAVDEENRMKLALNCLLIQYKGRNILVNAGIGEKFSEKFKKIYKIERQENIILSLEKAGITPEDVDFVIFTHLHLDHCGAATRLENRKSQPVFPNARYIIQKEEWESALNPNELTRGSYLADNILPLKDRLILIDNSMNLAQMGFAEIRLIKTKAHSEGHQIVEITDNNKKVVYVSDLIPTSKHVHLPYIMAWDIDPVGVINKKKELLSKFAEEDYTVLWEHDVEYGYGKIGFENGKYFAKDLVPKLT